MKKRKGDIFFDNPDLKFDVSAIVERAKRLPKAKVTSVSINLPFISVNVEPTGNDKKIARELIIRLRDKRVLNSRECCDTCVRNALDSIQDIRKLFVDKQVELSDEDSPLFLILDLMLAGIRQFLTFTQQYDPMNYCREYQITLDILRGHLIRCIVEIAKVGGVSEQLTYRIEYSSIWNKQHYLNLSKKNSPREGN